jgi:hypothetical protein
MRFFNTEGPVSAVGRNAQRFRHCRCLQGRIVVRASAPRELAGHARLVGLHGTNGRSGQEAGAGLVMGAGIVVDAPQEARRQGDGDLLRLVGEQGQVDLGQGPDPASACCTVKSSRTR